MLDQAWSRSLKQKDDRKMVRLLNKLRNSFGGFQPQEKDNQAKSANEEPKRSSKKRSRSNSKKSDSMPGGVIIRDITIGKVDGASPTVIRLKIGDSLCDSRHQHQVTSPPGTSHTTGNSTPAKLGASVEVSVSESSTPANLVKCKGYAAAAPEQQQADDTPQTKEPEIL